MDIVIFRSDKHGVTAVFPEMPSDIAGHFMTCYSHVGQHGGCSKEWYFTTRPATYAEYAPLLAELVQIGYSPLQRKRITRQMDDKRRKEALGAVRQD